MNRFQQLWWEQASSDHQTFLILRNRTSTECHLLHYLQMATEKIAKAYFWRSGAAPPKSHAGFVQFLRILGSAHDRKHQQQIAGLFRFGRFSHFQNWIHVVLPIAYDLEKLAPSLSNSGPNPEYPWPHTRPANAPVNFQFPVWNLLSNSGNGRDLMKAIEEFVLQFPKYADL
jgi:hypothetical protein